MPAESQSLPEKTFAGAVMALAFAAPISIAAAQAAAVFVLLSGFWLGLRGSRREPLPFWISASLLLFLAALALSSALAPSGAIPQLKKSWVLLCFFPLVLFRGLIIPETLIRYLFWGTATASAVGIFRFVIEGLERAAPYSGGYTTMALFEAAMLPFCLAFLSRSRGWRRGAYALGGIIILAGLILSGTRAGWLAALAGLVIFGLFAHRKAVTLGILTAVVVIFVLPQSRRVVMERFASGRQGGFTTGRSSLWRAAGTPLANLPFQGYGPGSFMRLVPDTVLAEIGDPGIKSWHSTPLEILLESGPPALLGLLGMVIASLVQSWKLFFRGRSGFALALFSSLAALCLASLTTNVFRDFLLMSLLVILWITIYAAWLNPAGDIVSNK